MSPEPHDKSWSHRHRAHHRVPDQMQQEDTSLCGTLTKNTCPESVQEETLDKPKQRTFDKLSDLESENIKVKKDEEGPQI